MLRQLCPLTSFSGTNYDQDEGRKHQSRVCFKEDVANVLRRLGYTLARERGSHSWFVNEEERTVVSTDRASANEFDQSSRISFEILKVGDLMCHMDRRIEGFLYTETG